MGCIQILENKEVSGLGTLVERAVYHMGSGVVLWCVGVPVAVMFAAYLIGIAVMCVKELWNSSKKPRSR